MKENFIGKDMKRIYIDMDDTLCDFISPFREERNLKYPHSKEGFFLKLEPLEGALDTYRWLEQNFDVWILTAPSVKNPLCYTEKRLWVEKHLGLDTCEKLILCPNKSLLIGDYLIDDTTSKGQLGFRGTFLHFGKDIKDWIEVREYFSKLLV